MMKIAVTGGAGFIGSNLVARLLEKNYEVVVIDDLSTGLMSNIERLVCNFHRVSVTDFSEMKAAISDCGVIVHLAARGSVPRSIKNPVATHDVNATGTLNVLQIARESGAHVIFSSSSSVYGRNLQLPKNESMWLGPMTPYAASKLAAESYVQAYSSTYGVPTTLFRFFNVFGPHQRPDHEYAAVLPKWIWQAIQGKTIEVFGDGSVSRDFTYIDSVLDVLMQAIEKRVITSGAINLAYGNRIFLNDVIDLLQAHFPHLEVSYRESRVGDVKESQNDPILLKELFPDCSPVSFNVAFNETVSWLKKHGSTISGRPNVID